MQTMYTYLRVFENNHPPENEYFEENFTFRTVILIYIYIYIYIVIHRQTVSFYQNSSVWLDTQDARSWDRNPSNFTLYCISDHLSTKRTKQQQQPLFTFFYTLSATRALNSFEELRITLAATGNSFARELNPIYIYIYIYEGEFHVIFFFCFAFCFYFCL